MRAVIVDGHQRLVRLMVPPLSQSPGPLVIALHGWGEDADRFATLTRIEEQAASVGATVAIPRAHHGSWQIDPGGADAALIDVLRAEVPRWACVDVSRIDLLGFSQGAALAIADACARPNGLAAVATVAVEFQLGCRRPLSLLAFHGRLDHAGPFEDGAVGASLPGVAVTGTWANMATWAHLDRCDATPSRHHPTPSVVQATWVGCAPGVGLELYVERHAGHSWPGADPSRSIEATDTTIDATALALDFFAAHPSRP